MKGSQTQAAKEERGRLLAWKGFVLQSSCPGELRVLQEMEILTPDSQEPMDKGAWWATIHRIREELNRTE